MGEVESSHVRVPVSVPIPPARSSNNEGLPVFKFTEVTCAICLDNVKNRAFVNNCTHAFCLTCLLKWSRHKLECPLCKQSFTMIYYCVVSQKVYKRIPLRYLIEVSDLRCSGQLGYNNSQLGRIKSLIEFGNMLTHDSSMLHINTQSFTRDNSYFFRKSIYLQNYWAVNELSRQEWIAPDYFVENPEALVRLFPWIYRELEVLLNTREESRVHLKLIDQIFDLVVSMLQLYEAFSPKCISYLKPYLGEQTHHFMHELIHFMCSRKSMPVYDKQSTYSSMHFLRGSAIRGAVVNGPGEYKEFITFEGNKMQISKGMKRERVISLFPTVSYADIVAITPDLHGAERIYALDDIGGGLIDLEKITSHTRIDPNPMITLLQRRVQEFQNKYLLGNVQMILEAIAHTCCKRKRS